MSDHTGIQALPSHSESALVQRSVRRTLFRMAFPMLAGTFAMNAYNLTDTWFVSRLGTLPLAAMGFTFPVVMMLTFVAGGLGSGVTTLVSHAMGRRAQDDAAAIVTHGIAFTVMVSIVMTVAGILSMDSVFSWLGAEGEARRLVSEYMGIWYLGAITMSLPMLGNGILISAGDSKAASQFMVLGTGLNVILDPIMIFGYFGFPAMGISGAALATVISQAVSMSLLLLLLYKRHRLLVFKRWRLKEFIITVRRILGFGIPGMLSMMLMPISASVITRLLGGFGNEAIAAAGTAGRIEMFAFVIPMALGISMTPFISQNFGANRMDRIREAVKISTCFALLYGAGAAIVFSVFAPQIARIFTHDAQVAEILITYIRIISLGYGMMEVHRYCGFTLTGLHKPVSSTLLNALRTLVFLIPLSYLGAALFGVRGVFLGRLITDFIVGSIGMLWVRRVCKSISSVAAPAAQKSGAAPSPNLSS